MHRVGTKPMHIIYNIICISNEAPSSKGGSFSTNSIICVLFLQVARAADAGDGGGTAVLPPANAVGGGGDGGEPPEDKKWSHPGLRTYNIHSP